MVYRVSSPTTGLKIPGGESRLRGHLEVLSVALCSGLRKRGKRSREGYEPLRAEEVVADQAGEHDGGRHAERLQSWQEDGLEQRMPLEGGPSSERVDESATGGQLKRQGASGLISVRPRLLRRLDGIPAVLIAFFISSASVQESRPSI